MSIIPQTTRKSRFRWWYIPLIFLLLAALITGWLKVSLEELTTGKRFWPWSAYASCGKSRATELPSTVRIGLYEEFPNPWRLAKLKQLDFPVTLAIAAPSRAEFLRLREEILANYPYVREVVFWPVLTQDEGYYPGLWSSPEAIQRMINEATDVPLLWDLELPRGSSGINTILGSRWWTNRATITRLFENHPQPIHIWRTHISLGLDSLFLRLLGMYIDPVTMPNTRLHLDLYTRGEGQNAQELAQIMRCGVEHYGERFIPSLGVLNDNEGPDEVFVPVHTFRRNLHIAREAGVSEIWIFGANGLNPEYLEAMHATLPLEK